jgi:hypothetical protein
MISPDTASGAYMAIGSSAGASVAAASVGAGASVAAACVGAGASVAPPPQAVRIKLMAISTNINVRTNLVISSLLLYFLPCHSINRVLRTKEEQVNVLLRVRLDLVIKIKIIAHLCADGGREGAPRRSQDSHLNAQEPGRRSRLL